MDRVYGEPFGFDCPLFADELVGRQAFECLQPSPEIIGADEVGEVTSQLIVVVIVEAFDGQRENDSPDRFLIRFTLLDRAVHPFDLAAFRGKGPPDLSFVPQAPRVFDPREPVIDLMLAADAVEDVLERVNVPFVVGELDAIVGQHDVNGVRHGSDQVAQEIRRGHFPGLLVQFDIDKLGGAVDGDEQVKLAFRRLNLGNINVEVAERVAFERSSGNRFAGSISNPPQSSPVCRPQPRAAD